MNRLIPRLILTFSAFPALVMLSWAVEGRAQGTSSVSASVEGTVEDSQKQPVTRSTISLETTGGSRTLTASSDSQGKFRFEAVPPGSYIIHATRPGYAECTRGPFDLSAHETKSFVLRVDKTPVNSKDAANAITFSDEPAFTVAGVTDTTAMGGHGSGPVTRNSNALSKETASLAHNDAAENSDPHGSKAEASSREASIRAKLAREEKADLHVQLADLEESEGRPVEAVKDYERAAEMEPTEQHLFAWGAELLLHHAPEPAIEVFSKGHKLFPQSSRMLLGLGAAWYAQRNEEQAVKTFMEACDLNPADPTPYLFLGRLQITQQVIPAGWTERMKRFVSLQPKNAMAHYLYASALMKQSTPPDQTGLVESELNAALKLNPHLGEAYLALGILRLQQEKYAEAIAALESAVENMPAPDEAHYRLAQVYRRLGDTEKTNREISEFKKISQQKEAQTERERHEIPQFVYTLR
jgi:tetratricopeptide (TPR) repeat protein